MSVQLLDPAPEIETRMQVFLIRELELFIWFDDRINGYRIELFLSTNAGQLRSEESIEAREKPADWCNWSYRFRRIVDSKEPHSVDWLREQFPEHSIQNRLICQALGKLNSTTAFCRNDVEVKSDLFKKACSYINLF
ncbi:hypothetical protein M3194_02395 [Paenibacillus glycanilyticus]|uniref:hypothetical protein n=1 Tax=Paenibacillus glycanilyticus TaxID=126569 RepID=UPI002040E607|nr:hypothetical protein [Paenibacillus glycanilyticus]MCM3626216.1 hypothetical protein [Paenibacillus glycanilyticus]